MWDLLNQTGDSENLWIRRTKICWESTILIELKIRKMYYYQNFCFGKRSQLFIKVEAGSRMEITTMIFAQNEKRLLWWGHVCSLRNKCIKMESNSSCHLDRTLVHTRLKSLGKLIIDLWKTIKLIFLLETTGQVGIQYWLKMISLFLDWTLSLLIPRI